MLTLFPFQIKLHLLNWFTTWGEALLVVLMEADQRDGLKLLDRLTGTERGLGGERKGRNNVT